MKHDKGEEGIAAAGRSDPDPPSLSSEQTPFERFVDFARKIVAVPKAEIDDIHAVLDCPFNGSDEAASRRAQGLAE